MTTQVKTPVIKQIGIGIGLFWLPIICILSRVYDTAKPQLEYTPTTQVTYTLQDGTNCIVSSNGFAGTMTTCDSK